MTKLNHSDVENFQAQITEELSEEELTDEEMELIAGGIRGEMLNLRKNTIGPVFNCSGFTAEIDGVDAGH